MTDEFTDYVVQEHDTLSGIGQKNGVAWQDIASVNGIHDPRSLRPGQHLKIPAKVGKLHAQLLDAEHNPLSDVHYQIKSPSVSVTGKTPANGRIDDFQPTALGQNVEFYVQKLTGEWKKVYETTTHTVDRLVTLVSPRLKLSTETQLHPVKASSPQEAPAPGPKAAPTGNQTPSRFAPDKGVKTQQGTDKDGASTTKVTSDDASLDEFLDKYTGDPITEDDYKDAAKELACKVNVIKAVHETEVGAGSFMIVDGRTVPKILYERHYFYRLTGKKYWDTNPDLSYPVGYYFAGTKYLKKTRTLTKSDGTSADVDVWVPYNKKKDKDHASEAETGKQLLKDGVLTAERDTYGTFSYRRLRKAFRLDPAAALEACSWGAFQIMGANYKMVGYASVQEMVKDMSRSERPHLKAFVKFVKAQPDLLTAVQTQDFRSFASIYNGSSYAENAYDVKMKNHFDSLEKQDATKAGQESKK